LQSLGNFCSSRQWANHAMLHRGWGIVGGVTMFLTIYIYHGSQLHPRVLSCRTCDPKRKTSETNDLQRLSTSNPPLPGQSHTLLFRSNPIGTIALKVGSPCAHARIQAALASMSIVTVVLLASQPVHVLLLATLPSVYQKGLPFLFSIALDSHRTLNKSINQSTNKCNSFGLVSTVRYN
jgi:hypothetical protein